MKKELFIYRIKVIPQNNIYDEKFEEDVIKRIHTCSTYMNFIYPENPQDKSYYVLPNVERGIQNYYFAIMKKQTHVNANLLDDVTERVKVNPIPSNEFIRFGLHLRSNLITIVKRGNFGMDQFTLAFKDIYTKALKNEFGIEIGSIEFIPVPGIPTSWTKENLMDKIKDLNYLKDLEMDFHTKQKTEEEDSVNEIIETKKIKSINPTHFSTGISQIKHIEEEYQKYLDGKHYNYVELYCKDVNDQKYLISLNTALSYTYDDNITEKDKFISKSQDTIEHYIQNYLNK